MSEAVAGSLLTDFADRQVASFIERHFSESQWRVKIDKVLAMSGPFVDLIETILAGHEDEAADFLASMARLLIDVTPHQGFTSGPDGAKPIARAIAHHRLVRHLVRQKGMSHADAVAKANSLTVGQFDEAIGAIAVGDDPATWLQTILQFFRDHWLQILGILLGLIVLI